MILSWWIMYLNRFTVESTTNAPSFETASVARLVRNSIFSQMQVSFNYDIMQDKANKTEKNELDIPTKYIDKQKQKSNTYCTYLLFIYFYMNIDIIFDIE